MHLLLYKPITELDDFAALHSDLILLELWSLEQLAQLNPAKCKYMLLSRRRFPTAKDLTLFLCGSKLEKVDVFKYLGVLINTKLSWCDHIDGICNKARKILGLLYWRFYQDSSHSTLRALYITLVRPHLEYAAQLWDPHTSCDVNKLEAVQRFALRVISHQWDSTYQELLNIVKIQTLQGRRLKLKLTLMYKIAHGLCYFPAGVFLLHQSHSERLAKHHTMLCPHARTNYYFHSFVPSGVRAWNSLGELQACAGGLHTFKQLIKDSCSLSNST